MFDPFSHEDEALDEAIASAYADLKSFNADDEGYQKTVDQISKLYALKNQTAQLSLQAQQSFVATQTTRDELNHRIEHENATLQLEQDQNAWNEEQDSRPFYARVDPNTVLTVAGNVLIGLIVVKYEQTGVISSKVMSFMRKI